MFAVGQAIGDLADTGQQVVAEHPSPVVGQSAELPIGVVGLRPDAGRHRRPELPEPAGDVLQRIADFGRLPVQDRGDPIILGEDVVGPSVAVHEAAFLRASVDQRPDPVDHRRDRVLPSVGPVIRPALDACKIGAQPLAV